MINKWSLNERIKKFTLNGSCSWIRVMTQTIDEGKAIILIRLTYIISNVDVCASLNKRLYHGDFSLTGSFYKGSAPILNKREIIELRDSICLCMCLVTIPFDGRRYTRKRIRYTIGMQSNIRLNLINTKECDTSKR